ncbi:DUF1642 domain-containing protein [Streptococcus suis]|uniref:DUF1642 domain-containing protein n=1 Tax=Streptococcus suis TaxID=1307 RepID=A0A9X4RSA2_STRSU|nr:DUF1642 domain-containing protein [Streptococcus suis]MDG4517503.1 DUF1642 domain-containing protein [Streptococcus suis]MDG4523842.1 DUF1642 domain-containing protein [Streptococcus suis]
MNRFDATVKVKYLEDVYKDTNGNTYVNQKEVLRIIADAVDLKVEIPQFVADWIEHCKGLGSSFRYAISSKFVPKEVEVWLSGTENIMTNEKAFSSAWFYGYNIEGKQLYTVIIGNTIFAKFWDEGKTKYDMVRISDTLSCFGKGVFTTELNESEIKRFDKRLWEFAVPVNK